MLLLYINKNITEVNFETITKYNDKFDNLTSNYNLKFWKQRITKDKKIKYYCDTKEFKRKDQVIKYLLAIKNNEELDDE